MDGIVEGAELVAGGQIILKRGIQGTGRGKMKAGTNIVSKFIESATAEAGGFIQTESIMHSNVTAGEYHLAWKAVTDNTHPIIRKIKVLEVS